LTVITCLVGGTAFWIWHEQTRVRPVDPKLWGTFSSTIIGDIVLADDNPQDSVVLVNRALAWHPELKRLKLVRWDKKKPPRGFRRRLTPDWGFGPNATPDWDWGPLILDLAIRTSPPLSAPEKQLFAGLDLAHFIIAIQKSRRSSVGVPPLGQRGNVLYLMNTAGTFEPLITRDFTVDPAWVNDPESLLRKLRLLPYEGAYARLLQPDKVRIRTTKAEMDQCRELLHAEPIPTLVEKLRQWW
jgi:hypothetical protein